METVKVYVDPFTMKIVEGNAKVLEVLSSQYDHNDNKSCHVVFEGEQEIFLRQVHKSELEKLGSGEWS